MPAQVLTVGEKCVHFEPVNKSSNVFYDNVNKKVFTTNHKLGYTLVTAKGPDSDDILSFRLNEKGCIYSIKLSPDSKVVAVQRSSTTVEFTNVQSDSPNIVEYAQSCKGKDTQIIGIEWTFSSEMLFITDRGLELYQVVTEKRSLRSIRTFNINTNWYVYSPELQILILSCGLPGTILQPFAIQTGTLIKLVKFEVDLGFAVPLSKLALLDRDVSVVQLYDEIFILVLRHVPKGRNNSGAEIWLYKLNMSNSSLPNSVEKSHTLLVGSQGKFAVHIIDDLVVVHQQESKTSLIFDIERVDVIEHDLNPEYIRPVYDSSSIYYSPLAEKNPDVELYAPTWVLFQPNVIIDAKIGCMWFVELDLEASLRNFIYKPVGVDFVLRRSNSKNVILNVLTSFLLEKSLSLDDALAIWKLINPCDEKIAELGNMIVSKSIMNPKERIEQSDMYTNVLFPASENKKIDLNWFIDILLEYVLSLEVAHIPVQSYIQELLVTSLIKSEQFDRLSQLIRNDIVTDSKPMAFLMLSLEGKYPPALQLAMQLLSNSSSVEEIVEILLSKQLVLEALRYIHSVDFEDKIEPMKLVEAAYNEDDMHDFYVIFSHFEQRILKPQSSPQPSKGPHFEKYLTEYKRMTNS